MGYVFVMGPCLLCKQPFTYHPNFVPSIKVNAQGQADENGTREPICQSCFNLAQAARIKAGVPPWPAPHPQAYEAADENSVNWND